MVELISPLWGAVRVTDCLFRQNSAKCEEVPQKEIFSDSDNMNLQLDLCKILAYQFK